MGTGAAADDERDAVDALDALDAGEGVGKKGRSMSNVDTHRAAHQAMNTQGAEQTAAYYAPDAVFTDAARGLNLKGTGEIQAWLQEWKTMASDARIGDPSYIDAGDWTICRFQARGTHDGPMGDLPPTGKQVDMPFCEVMRWRDDKIVEGALYYDTATLMVQLGHMDRLRSPDRLRLLDLDNI